MNESERAKLDERKDQEHRKEREKKVQGRALFLVAHAFTCSIRWATLFMLAMECHVCMRCDAYFLDHDIRNLPLFCMFFCESKESVREDLACRDQVHLNENEWKEEEKEKKKKNRCRWQRH